MKSPTWTRERTSGECVQFAGFGSLKSNPGVIIVCAVRYNKYERCLSNPCVHLINGLRPPEEDGLVLLTNTLCCGLLEACI